MTTSEENTAADEALQNADVDRVAIFDVLTDPHRRIVVSRLDEHDGELAIREVADEIARRESDGEEDATPGERAQELYLELHHVHVPKMVGVGLVEYDEDEDTVSLADDCDDISSDLDLSTSE